MTRGCWFLAALILAAGPGNALADDSRVSTGAFTRPLSDRVLAVERGGAGEAESQVWNIIDMNGRADNISVNNAITGDNSIGGGSFSGSRGFPTVIQNSGNGVLIQNATIINVTVKP
jgi:hypothetical protein